MPDFSDLVRLENLKLIEELYHRYAADRDSVDPSWRYFFEGMDFSAYWRKQEGASVAPRSDGRCFGLIEAFRTYGHLAARCNPLQTEEKKIEELDLAGLGFLESEMDEMFPTFGFCGKEEAPLREIVDRLKAVYCDRIGFEYMGLASPEMQRWVQARLEPAFAIDLTLQEKQLLLDYLTRSEVFESFLHMKYPGQTRFSLEGAETMIPILAEIIDFGGELGVEEVLIGMAHRGRLNVLANILNKPLPSIFKEFEDDIQLSFSGNDDVKYHMGYEGWFKTRSGRSVEIDLAANPSHLESVDPVILGQTYAKQLVKGDLDKQRIVPILIHGDASLAGQGVVYESLQLMNLPSYSVGGTLHLIVNNQIGYTTLPEEGRSTRYCTDIAKAFGCPVFHVNAEDPESCLFAVKLALEIRQKFHCDVFIDLLCYRKYGHNEGDEPSFTQPVQYRMIRGKKAIRHIYIEKLLSEGNVEQQRAQALDVQLRENMKEALKIASEQTMAERVQKPSAALDLLEPFASGVSEGVLRSVLETFCKVPEGFHLHPKLQKWVADRLASWNRKIDWATGECLAFGSLLKEGVSIRLAGQDSQRGTFSQRHMMWIDSETARPFCPFSEYQTPFYVVNSPLTEYAGMGFEYGYSRSSPDSLVLWEAQYGDFNNGAEIIIDQYLVSAEQKWNWPSALTLLLPHGYEGAGPEHSSARMERFLQLAAGDNIQVVNPSSPAQYFHLLRRQALRQVKKPLIVFTPKSLLRAPACVSDPKEFETGSFQEVLDDPASVQKVKRLIFCSGKVFYDLLTQRKRLDTALIRVEQLYPLHLEKLEMIFEKYRGFQECWWVQEEPQNMGAWIYISPFLSRFTSKLHYAGRPANATTATGSSKKHKQEQAALVQTALGE